MGTGLCFSARTVPLGFVGWCCSSLFPRCGVLCVFGDGPVLSDWGGRFGCLPGRFPWDFAGLCCSFLFSLFALRVVARLGDGPVLLDWGGRFGCLPGPSPWGLLGCGAPCSFRFSGCGFWRVLGDGPVLSARTVPLWVVGLCCSFLFSLFGLRVLARPGDGPVLSDWGGLVGFLPGPSPWGLLGCAAPSSFRFSGSRVLARLWDGPVFFCPDRPLGVCLCGSVGADEVAADSCGVPGGEAGGDGQVVVRVLASVRADGGDLSLQDMGVRQFSVHPE